MLTYNLKVFLSKISNGSTKWIDTGMVNFTPLSSSRKKAQTSQKLPSGLVQWLMRTIPAFWEVKMGRSLVAMSLRPAWPTWWNPVSTKNTKISQACWCTSAIPATWEAEAQESLEPRRWRLQRAKIVLLHSSLGDSKTLSQKKNEKNKKETSMRNHKAENIPHLSVVFLGFWN